MVSLQNSKRKIAGGASSLKGWCSFKIQKEKLPGLQFKRMDY
jgi:hypothetical protein